MNKQLIATLILTLAATAAHAELYKFTEMGNGPTAKDACHLAHDLAIAKAEEAGKVVDAEHKKYKYAMCSGCKKERGLPYVECNATVYATDPR